MPELVATSPAPHPAAPIWPPARLRIVTPRIELRLPTDGELVELMRAAAAGVHDPASMPFAAPWSDEPEALLGRNAYAWHMQARGSFTRRSWTLLLVAFVDGRPVGAQDVGARDFPIRREVGSGSWIARSVQGRGIGTEMREAVLHFSFEGLGALAANSGAYDDNPASNRVSQKAGYSPNGVEVITRRRGPLAPGGPSEERAVELRYRIERDAWLPRRRDDIELIGLDDELLAMCGARDAGDAPT